MTHPPCVRLSPASPGDPRCFAFRVRRFNAQEDIRSYDPIPNMRMQLTFVSHYGPKPGPFAEKICLLQSVIGEQLGSCFEPYTVEQVHGTIIGLEGARFGTLIRNNNFWRFRGAERFIDFQGLLDFLRSRSESIWDVHIGGYDLARDHGFTSAGQHPFLRSFSVRGETAVAMGWPHRSGTFVPSLNELRRAFQQFGALHKWHQRESDVDNDFFFVLGRVAQNTELARHDAVQQIIREHLAAAPLQLPLTRATLSFVAYLDPQLPPDTSQTFHLIDQQVTASLLAGIYDDDTSGLSDGPRSYPGFRST